MPAESPYCSTGAKLGLSTAVSDFVPEPATRRAEPKSSRIGRPLGSSKMLSGEMSRWNTPARCSRSSASRIGSTTARSHASSGGARIVPRACISVMPGQYCIAM